MFITLPVLYVLNTNVNQINYIIYDCKYIKTFNLTDSIVILYMYNAHMYTHIRRYTHTLSLSLHIKLNKFNLMI